MREKFNRWYARLLAVVSAWCAGQLIVLLFNIGGVRDELDLIGVWGKVLGLGFGAVWFFWLAYCLAVDAMERKEQNAEST